MVRRATVRVAGGRMVEGHVGGQICCGCNMRTMSMQILQGRWCVSGKCAQRRNKWCHHHQWCCSWCQMLIIYLLEVMLLYWWALTGKAINGKYGARRHNTVCDRRIQLFISNKFRSTNAALARATANAQGSAAQVINAPGWMLAARRLLRAAYA